MCDPITLAGIALTGASTVANSIAQSRVQSAREDALAAERVRQGGLDREADAINAQSRDRFNDFQGQQDKAAGDLGQYFTDQKIEAAGQNADATAEQVAPQSGSALTVREEAKQRGQATAFANQQGKALGQLRAFGDVLGGISRDQARDASLIGQIGGFKRGSSNITPLELDEANQAGAGFNMLGDVLGLGGSLAINKGLSGSASTPTTLGDVVGYKNPLTQYPAAPRRAGFNLYGRT